MDFSMSPKGADYLARVRAFMDEHVYPNEQRYWDEMESSGDPNHHPAIVEELKAKAKSQGLWNMFLPDEEDGAGLTVTDYAPIAEETGRVLWFAPEVFNCAAPDTGNMEILHMFGTPEQKEQWLHPLLEGEIRSAFSMTEPDIASSDARNIRSPRSRRRLA